jgi:hypothetical protein
MHMQVEASFEFTLVESNEKIKTLVLLRFRGHYIDLFATRCEHTSNSLPFMNEIPCQDEGRISFDECMIDLCRQYADIAGGIRINHEILLQNDEKHTSLVSLVEHVLVKSELPDQVWYGLSVDELSLNTAATTDPIISLYELWRLGQRLSCCGTCKNAFLPGLGGADSRFGLYCFRQDPQAGEIFRSRGALPQQDEFFSRVSCFHFCEQYSPREEPI